MSRQNRLAPPENEIGLSRWSNVGHCIIVSGSRKTHRPRGAARQPSRVLVQSGDGAILYLKLFKDTAQSFALKGIAAPIHGRAAFRPDPREDRRGRDDPAAASR